MVGLALGCKKLDLVAAGVSDLVVKKGLLGAFGPLTWGGLLGWS